MLASSHPSRALSSLNLGTFASLGLAVGIDTFGRSDQSLDVTVDTLIPSV